jgi:hypothetical protein
MLRFSVQVLRKPDVHSRHAHIIRTSWGIGKAAASPAPLPCLDSLASDLDRHGPSEPRAQREGFAPQQLPIGPLRRSWALCEERIILA